MNAKLLGLEWCESLDIKIELCVAIPDWPCCRSGSNWVLCAASSQYMYYVREHPTQDPVPGQQLCISCTIRLSAPQELSTQRPLQRTSQTVTSGQLPRRSDLTAATMTVDQQLCGFWIVRFCLPQELPICLPLKWTPQTLDSYWELRT